MRVPRWGEGGLWPPRHRSSEGDVVVGIGIGGRAVVIAARRSAAGIRLGTSSAGGRSTAATVPGPQAHGLATATLLELFAWDEQTFLARTAGSAIRRIGYTRWQRNLAVALGNSATKATKSPHGRAFSR